MCIGYTHTWSKRRTMSSSSRQGVVFATEVKALSSRFGMGIGYSWAILLIWWVHFMRWILICALNFNWSVCCYRILESILKGRSFSTRRMSSTSIRLGSRHDMTLSRDDLSRAFFCSAAVYESSTEEAEILFRKTQREHPAVRFAKVHMSLNLPGEQKFLVAYAEDAIFIAFRGTTTLEDVAANLKLANHSRFGDAFHSGFFKRTDVFFKPGCDSMPGLLSLRKRIIFCGHSLGGAVAHMVLLRLFVENNWNLKDVSHYSQDWCSTCSHINNSSVVISALVLATQGFHRLCL